MLASFRTSPSRDMMTVGWEQKSCEHWLLATDTKCTGLWDWKEEVRWVLVTFCVCARLGPKTGVNRKAQAFCCGEVTPDHGKWACRCQDGPLERLLTVSVPRDHHGGKEHTGCWNVEGNYFPFFPPGGNLLSTSKRISIYAMIYIRAEMENIKAADLLYKPKQLAVWPVFLGLLFFLY